MTPHRRLLRLETVAGRHRFAHLTDAELDIQVRAELGAWLRNDPASLPAEVRADLDAFLAEPHGKVTLPP